MKNKRRQSVGGAVLIMILTVMFVLIIMLMATLTVVSTAGQRIYTKYEENQAYYSARSALDVFTQNMLSDAAYYAYDGSGTGSKRQFKYTDTTVTPAVVKNVDMKQGCALQLDLYKIRSQNDDGIDLQYAENPEYSDGTFASSSPEEKNYALDTANSFTKNGTTYKGLEYIEYDVTLPAMSDGSNQYGKMVDTDTNDEDGDGNKKDQIARIKVEVLDRKLATDPTYTTDDIKNYFGGDTSKIANDAALQAAIAKGPRSKDYMKIKITSTVKMMGVDGVAIVIFETTDKDPPANNQAINTTGSFAGGSGAQLRAAGGAATMDIGVTEIGDGNNTAGTLFTTGQFKWTSSATTKLNKGESVVAMGGIAYSPNDVKVSSNGNNSFAFWGGESEIGRGEIGDATNNIPLIADKLSLSNNGFKVNGDAYINTLDAAGALSSNVWGLMNPGELTFTGTGYVKNIILPDSCFYNDGDGNACLEVKLLPVSSMKLCLGYTIKNKSGTITYTDSDIGSSVKVVNNGAVSSLSTCSEQGFDINKFANVKDKDGRIYRKYTLPFNVDGQNTIEVPTAQAYFGDFFRDGAFHDLPDKNAGDLKNFSDQTNDDPAHINNDFSTIYSQTNKDAWLLTGADMLATYLKDKGVAVPTLATGEKYVLGASAGSSEISLKDAIGAGNIVSMPTNGNNTISLDGNDKYYILDNSNYSGKVMVTGNNGRLIIILPEGNNVNFNNFMLVTDSINDTTTTIKNGTTKAPKIDIYGGDGARLSTDNNCLFTAYFIMPTTTIDEFKMGKQGITYDDGKGSSTSISQIAIVGSVVCRNFKCLNNATGIAYLDKNSGADSPGEPPLSVQASRYSRS